MSAHAFEPCGRQSVPGYIVSLDLLRAVAVLMVATAHFGRAFSAETAYLCTEYGRLGVDVFFVISGYVIPYSLARSGYRLGWGDVGPLRQFATKRFFRIHLPYLVAVALTFAIIWPWRHALGMPWIETWETAAKSLVYLHFSIDNPVFWSLRVEAEFYVLVAFLFPLLAHRRIMVAFCTLAGLLLLARLTGEPGGAFDLPQYLPRFAAGIALFWLGEGRLDRRRLFLFLGVLWFWDRGSHEATAALLTALLIVALREWHRDDGKVPPFFAPLLFVGTISYSLFLIHLPIGGKIIVGLRFLVGAGEAWGLPIFLAALAVAIGAAFLFHRWIEAPCHRLAIRLGKR